MPKKNNSQEYWAKRRQQDKIKVINTGENGINNLKKLLKLNIDDVEKQITKYYTTFLIFLQYRDIIFSRKIYIFKE